MQTPYPVFWKSIVKSQHLPTSHEENKKKTKKETKLFQKHVQDINDEFLKNRMPPAESNVVEADDAVEAHQASVSIYDCRIETLMQIADETESLEDDF